MKIIILTLLFINTAFAQFYLTPNYGTQNNEFVDFAIGGRSEELSATEIGLSAGYMLNTWLSIELSYSKVEYEESDRRIDYGSGDVLTYSYAPSFENISLGIRAWIGDYITYKLGVLNSGYSRGVNDITASGSVSNDDKDNLILIFREDCTGFYTGFGINIPIASNEFFLDATYTLIDTSGTLSSDVEYKSLGFNAGFRFFL